MLAAPTFARHMSRSGCHSVGRHHMAERRYGNKKHRNGEDSHYVNKVVPTLRHVASIIVYRR